MTVSTPDGQESYRYDGLAHKSATFDRNKGENGLNQFSAMSVFGDTAIITLVMPADQIWESHHGIKIDSFNAGHSETYEGQNQSGSLINVITPQSSCGVNERRDVACWQSTHSVEYERSRPVARLLMAGSGLCTGWRVGNDNHMFTNNHCLSTQGKLENTEIWFNYQRSNCGGSSNVTTIKVTGRELLQTDYDLDYSLFTVNNFADITQFGNFGLEPRTPSLGETIYIAQHGAGNPKELAIESDQNAGGLCQIDLASTNGRAAGSDTGYFCDTTGGSSGSPVIARSSNKVIALHHFGGCENQGVRIDKIWPQVSAHFGDVVPDGDAGPTQNQPPVAQIDATCSGLSCNLDGLGSSDDNDAIVDYSWDMGDGTLLNGVSVQHHYAATGSYTLTLTVTDDQGLNHTRSQQLTVTDSGTGNELYSDTPVSNLTAKKDEELSYFISTGENNREILISITGGTGDADLYVKSGAEPGRNDYDCRPYIGGNNEQCRILMGTPGKVYVKLIAFSDFSDVELLATIKANIPDDFPRTNLSADKENWLRFSYTVPQGVTQLVINSTGGTGDADLYVKKGAAPSQTDYDCRPYQSANDESCSLTVSQGEQLHIGLRAYQSFSGVSLDIN
ncbi:PKD domain-containing protein [Shewanella psychropiezotolerans]|uniref:PKD domain-containing protein n=1 Tax=Shewanella psychropiezotolerans TaxID=2593655 RepID=A0ABX5X3Y8_9GAMM|nr:pre-peptidase C-terminal domain-containing protein [Shewanella psychropiezotolerans]QDO85442.1 PKD domain-containing protein [Shewanella psychropiezotolerans]